jgi:hypothetical protein
MKPNRNLADKKFKTDIIKILKHNTHFANRIVLYLDNEGEICNSMQREIPNAFIFQFLTNQSKNISFPGLKVEIL